MLAGARMHLRLLLLLKCASFALGALQLRSGYPPPASYRCAATEGQRPRFSPALLVWLKDLYCCIS